MNLLVNIDVDDLDRATAFYCHGLGLQVGRHFGDWLELVGGTSPIYLLPKDSGSAISPASSETRDYARHWTPVHLDFIVEDIDAAVARALAAGAGLEQPVSTSAWGRLAVMADPFGHGFCFVQFSGRGYDELAQS